MGATVNRSIDSFISVPDHASVALEIIEKSRTAVGLVVRENCRIGPLSSVKAASGPTVLLDIVTLPVIVRVEPVVG